MALTMNTLVADIVGSTNLNDAQVREALKGFVGSLQGELNEEGGAVTVTGLGTFRSVKKGDRQARNPRTGEKSYVEPYLKVTYKSSNLMADKVNGRR